MKFVSFKTVLVGYITFFVALSVASVGDTKNVEPGVYDWTLVPMITLFILLPAIIGYLAGKEDAGAL